MRPEPTSYWIWDEWFNEFINTTFLPSLQARYAYPKPNPLRSTTKRPDRPVVRSLRSVNRNR